MFKKGIVIKLFVMTSIMSIILFIGLIGFQDYFFNNLYFKTKVMDIVKNSDEIIENFSKENYSILKIMDEINDISRTNNFDMFIINKNRANLFDLIQYSNIVLLRTKSKQYLVDISALGADSFSDIKENKNIEIEGNVYEDWEFFIAPNKIRIDDDRLIYNRLNDFFVGEEIAKKFFLKKGVEINTEVYINSNILNKEHINISGVIETVKLNEKFKYSYLKEIFDRYVYENNRMSNITSLDKYTEIYEDEKTDSKVLIYTRSIGINGLSICVVASLQEISEAGNIMQRYYPYMIIVAAIIILLLAYIYSRIIAKPLLELNEVAMKMSNLDFEVLSNIQSKDELGNLSDSLNVLSEKLKKALNELQFANDELKLDIEKEKKQENIRREFIANVSHELKTPIGVIKSFTEGIKDGVARDKREYYLDVIIEEADEMNELVLEMIELSKLESNELKLDLVNIDLVQMIKKNYGKFKELILKKRISFEFHVDRNTVIVVGDFNKINHVVENLFSNAVNYTYEKGNIVVCVKSDGMRIKVEFKNTCDRIQENELERIWGRFYKIDESRTEVENSTGLGLSIVKSILERHKSEFGVENTDLGIKFYFWLNKK